MGEMHDVLAKIREAKEERGLSYQAIADITEKNGEAVSLSTVKRVLHKDADIEGFRYEQTIRPIIRAVIGMDEEDEEPDVQTCAEHPEQYHATIEAMKSVIDMKHDLLLDKAAEVDRMRAEIEQLKESHKEEIRHTEEEKEKKVTYLKAALEEKKKELRVFQIILGVISAIVFVVLILDVSFRSFGWFQW